MNNDKLPMLYIDPYDRMRAVEYARRWAFSRNPAFQDYTGIGGDCTNFVSQAVYAGSCQMNFTDTFGWYFISPEDRAPAWSGVDAFFDFFTGSGDFEPATSRVGPFGYPTDRQYVTEGDVVQLANDEGRFYHTLMITKIEGDEIYVSGHTNDVRDRPLSSYTNASERFIRIVGVLREGPDAPRLDCFDRLIEGAPEI